MSKHFNVTEVAVNDSSAMETRDHSKNGVSPKNQRSRKNFRIFKFALLFTAGLMICSVSCKKDKDDKDNNGLNLSGTSWKATVGNNDLWSTLYFNSSSSVTITMGIPEYNQTHTETNSYTVSGNTIKTTFIDATIILEKSGDYLYWDIGNGAVLKYIRQ
jgi:hypothetical protein